MNRMIVPLLVLFTLWGSAEACVDPMDAWAVGAVFSGGEVFSLERIEESAADTASYLKICSDAEVFKGAAIREGGPDGLSADPLTITGVSVAVNTLRIGVQYSGGCGDHVIDLYSDGTILISEPGQINLRLSHDANGDECEAVVSDTLEFDLTTLGTEQKLILRVCAPGSEEPFSEMPLWTPASGAKTQNCMYKFRSAYSPSVMASVGIFEGSFQPMSNVCRVLLIFDTAAAVPSEAEKAAALEAELERLVEIGVVALDAAKIDLITAALSVTPGQYWTAEDTVLYFNMWFDGTSVNGVRGTYGAKGCGSGVAYELPANTFSVTAVQRTAAGPSVTAGEFRAVVGRTGISFMVPEVGAAGATVLVTDMAGRQVAVLPVAKGQAGTALLQQSGSGARLSSGCYFAALRTAGQTLHTCRVTVP